MDKLGISPLAEGKRHSAQIEYDPVGFPPVMGSSLNPSFIDWPVASYCIYSGQSPVNIKIIPYFVNIDLWVSSAEKS
jgi:hypothetical protein